MHTCRALCLLMITILLKVDNSSQECLCNVRRSGEYCGHELNEMNGNEDCESNLYYCGPTNLNKAAVVLITCQKGRECQNRSFNRNPCLRNIDCECGRNLVRGQRYCGRDMNGRDCGPNVIFSCPYVRIFHPSPQDACPNGCVNGTCDQQP